MSNCALGHIQIVPASLPLIPLRLKIQSFVVQHGQMVGLELTCVSRSCLRTAARSHCLDAGIPVCDHGVVLEVVGDIPNGRHTRISFERVLSSLGRLLLWPEDLQPLTKIVSDRKRYRVDDLSLVARKPFLAKEITEPLHEVRLDAEDVERLQFFDERRMRGGKAFATAFQAPLVALEPDATAEKLNDLCSFALADVHQTHRADPPAIPAFDELLGTDQQIDRRAGVPHTGEHRLRELTVSHLDGHGWINLLAVVAQAQGIADVDESERFLGGSGFEHNFARVAFDTRQHQRAAGGIVEDPAQDVAIHRLCRLAPGVHGTGQIGERSREDVGPILIQQARVLPCAGQDLADTFRGLLGMMKEVGHETQDLRNVRRHSLLVTRPRRLHDARAHKHPERFFEVERHVLDTSLLVDSQLLVELEDARRQVDRLGLLERLGQVQDLVVLPESVLVEVPV